MIGITWLGQGGFLLKSGDFRLLVDPYMSDCVSRTDGFARLHPFPVALSRLKPDLLLVTHDHMDHLDPDGVPLIRQMYPECRYAGPKRSYEHFRAMGIPEHLLSEVSVGREYRFGAFTVAPTVALHSDPTSCGYRIESEGKKIVLTGDTRYDDRLLSPELGNADLLLICINGKMNNMNADEALRCVRALAPKTALPMHIGLFAENTADPAPFIAGCLQAGTASSVPVPGREFLL